MTLSDTVVVNYRMPSGHALRVASLTGKAQARRRQPRQYRSPAAPYVSVLH
jgi:hypothetical protein